MKNHDENRAAAKRHTKNMAARYEEEIRRSIDSTRIYSPDFRLEPPVEKRTVFIMEKGFTQESILRHTGEKKLAVLNFASYRHPGGGFINGAMAQEESLCHSSFLYNVLEHFPDFYQWNEAHYHKGLYENRALYSESVRFFDASGLRSVMADVLTCAAPNRSMIKRKAAFSEEENEQALRSRILFLRDICEKEGVSVFIAGAFGCGVFAQKPEKVAAFFKEAFCCSGVEKLILAVPPDKNFKAFQEVFGCNDEG